MIRRFVGQELPAKARIGVISNDAIGNFVIATPLLQMLRAKYPHATLDYFAGNRVSELAHASDLFDSWYPLHGAHPTDTVRILSDRSGAYELVVNLESTMAAKFATAALVGRHGFAAGPCLDGEARKDLPHADDPRGDLWRDMEWISPTLTQKYPFLSSGFIAEIFCRLAYLEGTVPAYRVPSDDPGRAVPDVLIATSASLPEKLWPAEKWSEALSALKHEGVSVGLLGAPPSSQSKYWQGNDLETQLVADELVEDLRGKLTMPQVVGALAVARAVLTLDNGILHLAAATGTPTVGLFRYGIHRLWAPPVPSLTVLHPAENESVGEIPVDATMQALKSCL
ncbi:MAG: glycosyltransferase family 9 protein [Chthonomonas sp.]|nr:glycosyltransferase family 9 protein [Chthonomonas sp.]